MKSNAELTVELLTAAMSGLDQIVISTGSTQDNHEKLLSRRLAGEAWPLWL